MYKHQIYDLIEKALKDMGIAEIPSFNVGYPPDSKLGDYATNAALVVAKILKKDPNEVALNILSQIYKGYGEQQSFVKSAGINIKYLPPGFINFFIEPEHLQKNLVNILKQKDKYGSSKIGKGKTVVVDYSAPNIAKMMHVGHLRSTVIGQAVYNIYKFLGYKAIGDNHIGDWGTHFGKLIYAYKNFVYPERSRTGDKENLKENFILEMNRLYVDFNSRAKEDEKLNDRAREETRKFQEGDKENVKIWKYFVRESMKEFDKIYKILGVKIDKTLGESFYQPMLKEVISEAVKKGIAEQSDGALIVPLEKYNLPPYMIQKTDGATLYGTTDLATLKYRVEKWKAEKIIYVVANEQSGHFMQLFKVGELIPRRSLRNLICSIDSSPDR